MLSNLIKDAFCIIQNLLVSESQHAVALRNQIRVATLIVMPLIVWIARRTIPFNYKTSVVTIEVGDVVTKLMLPSEFEPEQAAISDQFPQQGFRRCLFLS